MNEAAMRRERGGASGFSLMEMMVAMAIVAILLRLAAPSFASFMSEARLSAESDALAGALTLARSEAATRGVPVRVAPDPSSTPPDWTSKIIVRVGASGESLREVEPSRDSVSMSGEIAALTHIEFNPDGSVAGVDGSPLNLRLCDGKRLSGRHILITASGYVTVSPTQPLGNPPGPSPYDQPHEPCSPL